MILPGSLVTLHKWYKEAAKHDRRLVYVSMWSPGLKNKRIGQFSSKDVGVVVFYDKDSDRYLVIKKDQLGFMFSEDVENV